MPRTTLAPLAPVAAALAGLLLTAPSSAAAQAVAKTVAPDAGAASAAAQTQPPLLVVFITIDQLRPDYFTRFGAQLTGGLRRLYDGGAVFTNGTYDHAITETAPGHSVVMSGRHPGGTGILLNDEGVPDPYSPLIDSRDVGASPFKFRGSALVDWMRNADSSTRALSVSRKDRGAILPLGRAKHAVYWYASRPAATTPTRCPPGCATSTAATRSPRTRATCGTRCCRPTRMRSRTACRWRTAGARTPSRTSSPPSRRGAWAASWPRRR
jgi:hypothetical protein